MACGIGRCESVERVSTGGGVVSFTLKCSISAPARVRVGTSGKSAVVVDSVSECLRWGCQAVGRGEGQVLSHPRSRASGL